MGQLLCPTTLAPVAVFARIRSVGGGIIRGFEKNPASGAMSPRVWCDYVLWPDEGQRRDPLALPAPRFLRGVRCRGQSTPAGRRRSRCLSTDDRSTPADS